MGDNCRSQCACSSSYFFKSTLFSIFWANLGLDSYFWHPLYIYLSIMLSHPHYACLVKFSGMTNKPNIHIYPHLIPGIHLCIMFQQVKMSRPICPMKSRSLPLQKNFTSIKRLDRLYYFNGHFPVKSRSEYVSWHLGNP